MKCYILAGNAAEVDKVIRENRLRIQRGLITITPFEMDDKDAGVVDTKDLPGPDDKSPKKRKK